MSLLLAPYNNAMRLGQGFNSYTQEICIDDAVIVDPGRAPNQITNDGTTMLDLKASMRGPSAYTEIDKRYPEHEVPITGQRGGDVKDDVDPPKPTKTETQPGLEDEKEKKDEEEDLNDSANDGEGDEKPEDDDEDEENKEADNEGDDKEAGSEGEEEAEDKSQKGKEEKIESEKKDGGGDEDDDGANEGEQVDETGEEGDDNETDEGEKERQAGLQRLNKEREEKEKKEAAIRKEANKKAEVERAPKRTLAKDEEEERSARARKRAQEKFAEEASSLKAYTQEEMDAFLGKKTPLKSLKDLGDKTTRGVYRYNPTGARGPAQIVTYSSRFVEKLSDITDDMNISGALSIKYGTIGGSGRGAFINTEKFQESDLNFYISVKVINQTTNLKDALIYQPLRSVSGSNFREVYGDSFISGFIEGGEFNAVVSMKVHNKEKITDIRAQAKVALSVGMASVKAEAAVRIAKKNINNNTETTVQVSWSGGGYIKPIDEPWDINSLTSAAGRFPDLVATTPQRIYAILTKYETLRSFVKLKPAAYSAMQYENAQLYTNMLMDTYMDYKTILKNLATAISDVESRLKAIKKRENDTGSNKKTKFDPKNFQDETPFPATLGGLDRARRACRFQMIKIVNEIDDITKDPKLATDEDRYEPFQTPRVFKERLPILEPVVPVPTVPLSYVKIGPRSHDQYPPLCEQYEELETPEKTALTRLVQDRPDVSRYFRLTRPIGSINKGAYFNNVDFLKHGVHLTAVKASTFRGCVSYVGVTYSNGLTVSLGCLRSEHDLFDLELNSDMNEKIIAGTVETGEEEGSDSVEPRLTKLVLFTNRGNKMVAQPPANPKTKTNDRRTFTNFETMSYDPVMDSSCIKGFWGCSQNGRSGLADDGIWRLGVVWGNELEPEVVTPAPTAEDKSKTNA